MNVVLVVADQQRPDLIGGFGRIPVHTPTLDRLLDEGTAFTRAYTASPLCTPSRASMLTGQYPSRHGAWSIGTDVPEDTDPWLPDLLANQGAYRTAIIGKSHFRSVLREGSFEALPRSRDWEFFREWTGPWYGFQHAKILNGHVNEAHAYSMHYGLWLRDQGIPPEPPYFYLPGEGDPNTTEGVWALPEECHSSRWIADEATTFLEDYVEKDQDVPFFLYINFTDPHRPFYVPSPWDSMHDDVSLPPPIRRFGEAQDKPTLYTSTLEGMHDALGWQGNPSVGIPCQWSMEQANETRSPVEDRSWRIYMGMQCLLDHHLGRILDTLDALDLTDDTLVIYTADHGDYMGDHWLWSKGGSHYDAAVRVPLIVRWPGRVPAGATNPALQSLVDLAPTILQASGIPGDPRMQGVNQLGCWEDPSSRAERSGVLIDHRVEAGLYVNSWITRSHRLSVHSILAEHRDEVELYDLETDPGEFVNLAAVNSGAGVAQELLQALLRYRMSISGPWQERSAFS